MTRRLFGLALVVLVLASGVRFLSLPIADNDLWGHVYFGQEILSEGGLPETNRYSYTAPEHRWVNHEILAEVLFAATYDRAGGPGLLALKLGIGLAMLGILQRSIRRRTDEPLAMAAALIAAASLTSFGYLVRPQIFTFLFLAITWDVLQRRECGGKAWQLWLLPLLFVVWINTHGGVLAGLGVLGVFAIGRVLTRRDGKEAKTLLAVTAASIAAIFVNPYGWELPVFLVEDVSTTRPITEWASIPLFDRSNLHFKVTLLILLVATVLRRGRPFWETAVLALAAVVTFRHERHLPLFGILATPLLAEILGQAIRWLRERRSLPQLSPAALVLLAVGCLGLAGRQLGHTAALHQKLSFGLFVSAQQFPVHAVRFIEQAGLEGNLALPFGWGEYAIWHLYPRCRVSIDGRYTTAYPERVIRDAWRYMEGSDGWEAPLEEADLALVDRRRHGTGRRLEAHPDWRLAHADPTALLFVRTSAPPIHGPPKEALFSSKPPVFP